MVLTATVNEIRKTDEKRFKKKQPYLTKNEVLLIAQRKESWLLESEVEARVAGTPVHPRDTEDFKYPPQLPRPEAKPMEERLSRDIRDRLGPRKERLPDNRSCNNY